MYATLADITAAMNASVGTIAEAMKRGALPFDPADIDHVQCLGMNKMGVFVYEFEWSLPGGDKGTSTVFCKLQHDLFTNKVVLIGVF